MTDYIFSAPDHHFDVVVFLEVYFFLPNYQEILKHVFRVLKPGGILFSTFRSQYHYALCAIRDGLWEASHKIIHSRSGQLWGSEICFNWHSSEEIKQLLQQELGFELKQLVGIGNCSGIKGDPLARMIRPSMLSGYEREQLMSLEIAMAPVVPDAGRYMLAVLNKPK